MNHIRKYVRDILKEIYEMTPEEKKRSLDWDKDARRALGLQSAKEIKKERQFMQNYQADLQSTPEGKQFIRAFMKGTEVTIFHSINYMGFAAGFGYKEDRSISSRNQQRLYSDWIKKHGTKGKDTLSTVAVNVPLGKNFKIGDDNDHAVQGLGFIMKGYPVLASESDMMTQTLGALPPGLVDHQKNSGIAKRGRLAKSLLIKDLGFKWAGEVILDNWSIIGTFYNFSSFSSLENLDIYVQDSLSLGMPIWVYSDGFCLGKVTDAASYDKVYRKASRLAA